MLEVQLLGAAAVRPERGSALPLAPAATTLLAFLALEAGRVRSHEALTAAFCADVPEQSARRRLNTSVWRLRKAIGDEWVHTTPHGVGLRGELWVDALDFEQRVAPVLRLPLERMGPDDARTLTDALALYTGDLLEGTYDDWVLRDRTRLADLRTAVLTRLVGWFAPHDPAAALVHARAVLDRDPLREDAHRAAMRACADLGRRQDALAQYASCVAVLRDELALAPLPETTALAATIAQRVDPGPRACDAAAVVERLRAAQSTLVALQAQVQRVIDDLVTGP